MKKSVKLIVAGAAVVSTLVASASAANFDSAADKLKTLGLFQGGTAGYELDRAPTRAEAATMLVRLLGKETEAKALTYSAPFTDLEDWQKPYVQYLYDNKLTTGATDTTFAPNDKCDAQMYTTMLLRALGHSDAAGGDFTYATALDKGEEEGVVDAFNCDPTNFLRDHVAAMSYTTLAVQPKNSTSGTLLDKLVADGAVAKDKAADLQAFFKSYKDYAKASETYSKEGKMSAKMNITANVKSAGADMMKMSMTLDTAADMNLADLNKSKMAMTGTMKLELAKALVAAGEQSTMEMPYKVYYTDGNYYMNMSDQKIKMPMDFSSMQGMVDMTSYTTTGLVAIDSLKETTANGATTYTVKFAPGAMNGMIANMMKSMNMEEVTGATTGLTFGDLTVASTLKDGKYTGMDMSMSMSVKAEGQSMDMTMTMKSADMKFGNDVKVDLPTDLASYKAIGA